MSFCIRGKTIIVQIQVKFFFVLKNVHSTPGGGGELPYMTYPHMCRWTCAAGHLCPNQAI